ncbi:DJ-1/PfpI family protein [uncultured Dubosiella sp.]|uniref:DJ-1/PfpI family protein n=1 Tax=uncultured Dubosiella sp. TaxID=1937011 RepID=UPI002731389A|nr:DJ-1/PfpI family protein [uncultured Dubosiella sp.]
MKCAILMDNGFEELEAMGPIALLRRGGVDVDVVSVEGNEVTGRFGVTYSPAVPMDDYDFDSIDCLIVPGGPHYKKLETNEKVKKVIRKVFEDDSKVLAAICAAPTVLGKMGLLEGKNYTCFEEMNKDFGGQYHYDYTVTDGNLVTGISAAAAEEFAFAIMEKLCGKEHTDHVKASIYYDAAH